MVATPSLSLAEIDAEIIRSAASPVYAIHNYWRIQQEGQGNMIPLHLWPDQVEVLRGLHKNRLVVLLKARQLGMTTIVIQGYAVWLAMFRPGSTILLFSKTQKEARDLIKRIRRTILSLPPWLQPSAITVDSAEELALSNGSRFLAFASRGSQGDSYSASLCVVDEADLIPDLNELLGGCKPTIDAGGQLVLLSRADKSQPESSFKKLYRAAIAGENGFWQRFLPWWSRPGRTRSWYEGIRRESIARTGSEDELYEQYPESPEQALAPRQLDKRLPSPWLSACYEWLPFIGQGELPESAPALGVAGLRVYRTPVPGRRYVIGIDPAQGNPNSDNSVAIVADWDTLEECAVLCGKFEPSVLTSYSAELAAWYNAASVMVERNNHGFTVLTEFQRQFPRTTLLRGLDDKPGWVTTSKSKTQLYNAVAEALQSRACLIHDRDTHKELGDIEASTLSAPGGLHDDRAIAYALCVVATDRPERRVELTVLAAEPESPPSRPVLLPEGVQWVEQWQAYAAHAGTHYLGEFETVELAEAAISNHIG